MHDPVFDIFSEEAKEHLGALEKGFLDLEAAAAPEVRREQIDNLFRHAHSLKGDARAIGLAALQSAAQQLEDILDGLRNAPEKVNREVINLGLAQLDIIRQAFEAWQRALTEEEVPAEPLPPTPLLAEEEAAEISPPVSQEPAAPAATTTLPEERFTVRVPSERLDRMLNRAGELRIVQRSGEELSQRLTDLSRLLADVLDRLQQMDKGVTLGPEHTESRTAAHEEMTRLRSQIEDCRDQVGRVKNSLRKKRHREDMLLETLEADIQQARLLPLVMLTDSLRRAVRDLGQSLDKSIRYDVDVGNVLLDKAILEALRDPLLHLLRNAASHGIETAAERRAAGKPPQGIIRVQAARRGSAVRILVSDDGRGVDFDRIRARVRQTEGQSEADLAALTNAELARYLFKPGFTTTVSRDAISGRGVGLDVVLNTVHRLHGTAALETSSAQGTTFALTLPVSISTIRILTVLCDGQYYGIPSTLIEKTGRVANANLRELEGCPVLPLNGEPVRWFPLTAAVSSGTTPPAPVANQASTSYVLIRQDGRHIAVAVDDMEEEAEVLLKPLGFPLYDLGGVIGAAVRPDGSVQIVLDLSSASFFKAATGVVTKTQVAKPRGRILVVDDSPTTRTILRNVFTAAGYNIRTATDGVDALERLRSEPVDLVISDVEMPRMDGFELTRQVKTKHHLPVILVTGMEKEEHRRKGLEAGADAYLVKSTFQGEGLLEIVKQFV